MKLVLLFDKVALISIVHPHSISTDDEYSRDRVPSIGEVTRLVSYDRVKNTDGEVVTGRWIRQFSSSAAVIHTFRHLLPITIRPVAACGIDLDSIDLGVSFSLSDSRIS